MFGVISCSVSSFQAVLLQISGYMQHLTPTDSIDAAASVHAYNSTDYSLPEHEGVVIGRYEDVQVLPTHFTFVNIMYCCEDIAY